MIKAKYNSYFMLSIFVAWRSDHMMDNIVLCATGARQVFKSVARSPPVRALPQHREHMQRCQPRCYSSHLVLTGCNSQTHEERYSQRPGQAPTPPWSAVLICSGQKRPPALLAEVGKECSDVWAGYFYLLSWFLIYVCISVHTYVLPAAGLPVRKHRKRAEVS